MTRGPHGRTDIGNHRSVNACLPPDGGPVCMAGQAVKRARPVKGDADEYSDLQVCTASLASGIQAHRCASKAQRPAQSKPAGVEAGAGGARARPGVCGIHGLEIVR